MLRGLLLCVLLTLLRQAHTTSSRLSGREKEKGGVGSSYPHLHCRDPEIGAGQHNMKQRRFMLVTGHGGGIGNYLIFFPAAYYFAALTGRDLLIADDSLFAEFCSVVHCGFPLYSQVAASFPHILTPSTRPRGAKQGNFRMHLDGESLIEDLVVLGEGYKYASGWYVGHNFSNWCIPKLTGCAASDVSCHDRHALQHLVRGPFHSRIVDNPSIYRVVGVPQNLKMGMLTLPHALAPRLDAAVHLRCQFQHFEYNVGPEDNLWGNYVKEVDGWLYSKDFNAGVGLFQVVEQKIMGEMGLILEKRRESALRRRALLREGQRALQAMNLSALADHAKQKEAEFEKDTFHGDSSDRIYVYLASDNDRVKDAFAAYLVGHANISVMRVETGFPIVHAKSIDYLKSSGKNGTSVFNLAMDWYALSLSNVVFAWRRDTHLTSTFAQSAQRASGNEATEDDAKGNNAIRGFHLMFRNGRTIWKDF